MLKILDVSSIMTSTHIEDYIHRVGRTGRAGRSGISYTFFTREDYKHASKFIDILTETEQNVPDELYKIARRPIPLNNGRHQSNNQSTSMNNSHIKPPPKPFYPNSTEKVAPPTTTHASKPSYMSQENGYHQQPAQKPQSQQSTYNLPYMYDGFQGPMLNPYATNGFNGYQQLQVPSDAYNMNTMNYFNQLQAAFGVNMLAQMPGQPQVPLPMQVQGQNQENKQDSNQQQTTQSTNSFSATNPQYPPQKS